MSLNLLTLLISQMLIYSAPLIFTSLGGVFSERAGIVNVGLEGTMVIGAFAGVVFNIEFAEQFGKMTPLLAVLLGGLVGILFQLIHATATIIFRAIMLCLVQCSIFWHPLFQSSSLRLFMAKGRQIPSDSHLVSFHSLVYQKFQSLETSSSKIPV